MIRPMPFSPTVVFTAPVQPRREAARTPEPPEAPTPDPFNRMVTQQRDAARLAASKAAAQTAPPTPAQPPTRAPRPEPGTPSALGVYPRPEPLPDEQKVADPGGLEADTPAQPEPDEKTRVLKRAPLGPYTAENQPAPLLTRPTVVDPDKLATHDMPGKFDKDADALKKLFKASTNPTPARLPAIPAEDPPASQVGNPPEQLPGKPNDVPSTLPIIEVPVEFMPAAATPAAKEESATQALQKFIAESLPDSLGKPAGAGEGSKLAADPLATAAPIQLAALPAAAASLAAGAGAGAGAGASASATADAAPASAAAASPTLAAVGSGAAAPFAALTRSASIDARPGTEAFESKFSAQVAVWVREGVQQAQLQLNPAELGPVRVAILLEGAAAQVSFTAEHALTRQALEQALPTLAGSLAEAGFTLAGGGVFDQARQPAGAPDNDSRRSLADGSSIDGEEGSAAMAAAVARPRGMVDLVA